MDQTEKVTRGILIALGTALIGAVFSVCVGLLLASNQYRTTVRRDDAARLTRQINLLILLRDELARIQTGIERGNFQVKLEAGVLQSAGYQWPTQIWNTLKWNWELLSVEPSLVQLLANTYDEIAHAEELRTDAASSANTELANYMENMMRGMGAPESALKRVHTPNPQLGINMKAYADAQSRIQQQLPPTLAALDIKINELRARMKNE